MHRNRSNVSFKIFSAASHILAANKLMEDQRLSTVVQSQFCINVNQEAMSYAFRIFCALSHTFAPKTYWRPKILPIKAQSQFVINSNHCNHSILNILCSVSHMLEKPEVQSQFFINSHRRNNSLEIFCAASHIFFIKPQYRSFLMLQSIISIIRFFSMCIFFQFYRVGSARDFLSITQCIFI